MKHFRHIHRLDKKERMALAAALLVQIFLLAAGVVLLCPRAVSILLLAAETAAFLILDGLLVFWLNERKQRELERQTQAELKAFLLKQRVLRHDFNIHLMALSGLLEAERYEELGRYLKDMLDASQEVSQLMPLDDPAVSAMLSQMISEAKQRGIQVDCLIYYNCARVGCDAYELNMILGNLIRNACEAVEHLPTEQRRVTLTILQRRNRCILRIENPLPEDLVLDERIFQDGYSGKKDHAGIGLASVHKLVSALGGVLFMEPENNAVSMIVQLPLEN